MAGTVVMATSNSSGTSFDKGDEKNTITQQVTSNVDYESGAVVNASDFGERDLLRQGLQQRHIQMIALAGTIGVGLFLNSGRALAAAGPLGTLLAYTMMSMVVASVVLACGEMGALIPLSGAVIRYAEFFVDPSMAFANGWNQIYSYCVSIPAEVVAAAIMIQFWNVEINSAVFITIFSLLLLALALIWVRAYGEIEFGFATLKIMLIVGINIMALVITCGGAPDHKATGFEYWKNPGPFVQYKDIPGSLGRFLGFWYTMNNALYALSGSENIAVAAAETKNPKRNIPAAAKRIFARVFIFYILTIFMTSLVVPSNDPHLLKSTGNAAQSPFVIAAKRAGIKAVPSIINAVIITSAWSSANSNMLSGPRILYGMAKHGHAPRQFLKLNRFGVPWIAICFIGAFMALGYMTLSNGANAAFNWLQDLVAVSTMVNYIIIMIIYLRFYYACKKQGIDRKKELPWAAPFQPYGAWFSLITLVVLYFTAGWKIFLHNGWSTESFISNYLNLPVVIILYFAHKYIKGTKYLRLDEIPIRHFINIANANPEPLPAKKKGLRKLNILWG